MDTSHLFLATAMLLIDGAWLSFQKGSYQRLVQGVQGKPLRVNLVGAVFSYLCVFIALAFVALPMIRKANPSPAQLPWVCLRYAGLLGFLIYGVFNFTNLAIFANYDVVVALMDTLWGTLLFTALAFFTVYFYPK